jgi:hypothetical protein
MERLAVCIALASASLLLWCAVAAGASYHVYVCGSWSPDAGTFVGAAVAHTTFGTVGCGGGVDGHMYLEARATTQAPVPNNQGASWITTAPSGLSITHIYTVNDAGDNVGVGSGWWGEFFWNGGPGPAGRSNPMNTNNFSRYGCCQASFNNRTVGWFFACGVASCTTYADLLVGGVDLTVNENQGPWLVAPSGLWQAPGWVRDRWPLLFAGDSPSGVCSLTAWINGQPLTLGASSAVARNTSTWHQCSGANASPTIQTADYGQGPMPLTIQGCDAAGVCTGGTYTKTIYVDNSHPWVSLSSPGDVADTGQAQYVTATAGGSASGIAEIDCRVDGGPWQRIAEGGAQQPSAQVPVSGLGVHTISCAADNTAVAQDGSHAWSTQASSTLKIGRPTISAISFAKVINGLRCHRVRKRVRVPAHWVTIRRHHKLVRVRRRAHTRVVKVTRCHLRIVKRRITVWVTVHRHGRKVRVKRRKVIRVPVPPRIVSRTTRRVRHGHGETISGWLGVADGTALGGQTIRVLTAPDNGLGQFSQATVASTSPTGTWTAVLPAGPSRLVEAVYDGGPTTESSVSGQARLIVPAEVKLLRVWPRRVPWNATVHLTGQLVGGYLPPGGALVRLRLGYGNTYTTYGVQEHVGGNGRFSTVATFGPGEPRIHRRYWFQIASLPMGNYPFAPAASRRVTVIVGGHPRPPHRHHRRRRKHRR